jgi:transcriptional regulator with XRE-family HTH domain
VDCARQRFRRMFPIMSIDSPAENRFRERVKQERIGHHLSQADLAKLLRHKGLEKIYATTVAKIESGDRSVRINEAEALADLFEMSIDALLGRTAPKNDVRYAARALHDAVEQAAWQVETIEAGVRDRLAELKAFPGPKGFTLGFPSACEAACDRLTDAATALHDALNLPATKPFQRLARKMLIEEWQKEEKADGAQS